ncbi:MAG: PD-(D/E)XK nuclease family protein [Phormidesmis sp.]
MIPLSQSHLTSLDTCPRKYQHIFYDALSGPASYEQQTTTQWGSQFHLLMQQQALDLPVDILAAADDEMSASLAALKEAAPEVFAYLPESTAMPEIVSNLKDELDTVSHTFSQSEHRRTLSFNGYLLTAVYDLLVIAKGAPNKPKGQGKPKGQIFDWKTHQQPPHKERLAQDWQTRLYPYLLCETSQLDPQDISMTYWFVRAGKAASSQPSFYTFQYGLAQHDQTRKDLQRLTDALNEMRLSSYFPQVAIEKGRCDRCLFNVRCDRISSHEHHPHHLERNSTEQLNPSPSQLLKTAQQITVDNVPEIPL